MDLIGVRLSRTRVISDYLRLYTKKEEILLISSFKVAGSRIELETSGL